MYFCNTEAIINWISDHTIKYIKDIASYSNLNDNI